LTKGRSKGVRGVLAFQTIEGMKAVYGEALALEITGMCSNKAFLRTDSPDTAKWAAQIIGDMELREWTRSTQQGSSRIASQTEHIVKRDAILYTQIMQLPLAENGRFEGYLVTPGIGVFHRTVNFAHQLRPLGNIANFIPRPPEDQYLTDHHAKRNPLDGIGPIADDDDPDGPSPDDDGGPDLDIPQEP
jgi:hypothetical protein